MNQYHYSCFREKEDSQAYVESSHSLYQSHGKELLSKITVWRFPQEVLNDHTTSTAANQSDVQVHVH